jgi:hypothetical protein
MILRLASDSFWRVLRMVNGQYLNEAPLEGVNVPRVWDANSRDWQIESSYGKTEKNQTIIAV